MERENAKDLYLPWNDSHVLGAAFDQPRQDFLAHNERCILEPAVCVWLVLANLSVEVGLCEEVRVERGERWNN